MPRLPREVRAHVKKNTVAPRGRTAGAHLTGQFVKLARVFGQLELTPQALMRSAQRITGLEDHAPEEIAEPLELLCEDFADEPPSEVGIMVAWTEIIRALAARLRVQRLDPSLVRPRRPPIVIVGWYRTGTTFLQNLLEALPGYDFVPAWRLVDPASDRLAPLRAGLAVHTMQMITPEMKILHPVSITGPQECWLLLAQHMIVDGYAFHWNVPRYENWLYRANRQAAYDTWARNLACFESRMNCGLVLKDPCHMLSLREIVAAVPDARIVWTHRDPVEAIGSFGSLSTVQHRMVYDRYAPKRAGRRCMIQIRRYLDRGMAGRAYVPEGQLVDIAHTHLRQDATAAVERMCELLDLPFDADAIRRREAALLADKGPRHTYELRQWGLSAEQIYDELSDYVLPTEIGRHPYGWEPRLNTAAGS